MRFRYVQLFIFLLGILLPSFVLAQTINLENIGKTTKEALRKNPFKISGGISSNMVFYASSQEQYREPFTYFLNGNINIGLYKWTLPISYSFTNQGSQLDYKIPWDFNRLSLSPKYKWVQAYLGDVSMAFSPYTYNGLTFRGVGLELTPEIPLKVSLMSGRLNKAVEEDGNAQTLATYQRMGYGTNLRWEKQKYKIGFIFFYAKDDMYSIKTPIDNKGIYPQENLVLSGKFSAFVHKNIEIFTELSHSSLTQDLRAEKSKENSKKRMFFFAENSTTQHFMAYNAGIHFTLNNTALGVKYERIDPEYKTLGAYYFNNDLENITLQTQFNLWKDKVTLSANIGRQIDNLEKQKQKSTNRWVADVSANIKASEKLMITTSYSNFTMFTNSQLNAFEAINKNPLHIQQPKDSIDFKQISQNVNFSLNYILSSSENCSQNINMNYSLNDMVSKENEVVRKGGISRFHNLMVAYSVSFPKKKLNASFFTNVTHSYANSQKAMQWGPSFTVNKLFLEDKLQTSFGASYNASSGDILMEAINFTAGANYSLWEKHQFSINFMQLIRKQQASFNETNATIGYSYRF